MFGVIFLKVVIKLRLDKSLLVQTKHETYGHKFGMGEMSRPWEIDCEEFVCGREV